MSIDTGIARFLRRINGSEIHKVDSPIRLAMCMPEDASLYLVGVDVTVRMEGYVGIVSLHHTCFWGACVPLADQLPGQRTLAAIYASVDENAGSMGPHMRAASACAVTGKYVIDLAAPAGFQTLTNVLGYIDHKVSDEERSVAHTRMMTSNFWPMFKADAPYKTHVTPQDVMSVVDSLNTAEPGCEDDENILDEVRCKAQQRVRYAMDLTKHMSFSGDVYNTDPARSAANKLQSHLQVHAIRRRVLTAVSLVSRMSDVNEVEIASIAMYCATAPGWAVDLLLHARAWQATNMIDWAKQIKEDCDAFKIIQNSMNIDLAPLFELEVLINRGVGNVDWDAERAHRTTDASVVPIPYSDTVRIATQVFAAGRRRALRNHPPPCSWHEFWLRRWEWAPTGSVHSQYPEDMVHVNQDTLSLANKWITLCDFSHTDLKYWSHRTPEIVASVHEKYEWGKKRALYGADLTSFVLFSYAFMGIEDCLGEHFPIGSNANDSWVKRLVRTILCNHEPFCFDFEDFNSQHSLASQQAVIAAYVNVWHDQMTSEQLEAASWCYESIAHCTVSSGPHGDAYEATAGMFSGWRMTAIVNSVLNYVYLHWAGIIPSLDDDLTSLHNGDDVILGVSNVREVITKYAIAKAHGIRAQQHKCKAFGIGEFLRVDHLQGSNGSQYLPRGIATIVHARMESLPANSIDHYFEACVTRASECERRGADHSVIARILHRQRLHACAVYECSVEDSRTMMLTHRCTGGLSEAMNASVQHRIQHFIDRREWGKHYEVIRALHGVSDYAAFIAGGLGEVLNVNQFARALATATARATLPQKKKLNVTKTAMSDQRRLELDRGFWKCYAHQNVFPGMAKAMLTHINPSSLLSMVRDRVIRATLTQVEDPIRFIMVRT